MPVKRLQADCTGNVTRFIRSLAHADMATIADAIATIAEHHRRERAWVESVTSAIRIRCEQPAGSATGDRKADTGRAPNAAGQAA